MRRPRVIIESPLRGNVLLNVLYADCLVFESLSRGEAPFLGHLIYPRVYDDADPVMRDAGIEAHIAYIAGSEFMVVGMDLGAPTSGMQTAIDMAEGLKLRIEARWLGHDWQERYVPQLRRTEAFR